MWHYLNVMNVFQKKGAALSAYKLQTHRYFICADNSF